MEALVTRLKGLASRHLLIHQEDNISLVPLWEEIQENIRRSTADNTTTMQDVAQGFSYLASPYKDDGSAKTVGEMIFEGSQAVSGSRAERAKTAQAGELAAQEGGDEKIKSDLAIEEAEKEAEHKYKNRTNCRVR